MSTILARLPNCVSACWQKRRWRLQASQFNCSPEIHLPLFSAARAGSRQPLCVFSASTRRAAGSALIVRASTVVAVIRCCRWSTPHALVCADTPGKPEAAASGEGTDPGNPDGLAGSCLWREQAGSPELRTVHATATLGAGGRIRR
jgi:hypothetical protein